MSTEHEVIDGQVIATVQVPVDSKTTAPDEQVISNEIASAVASNDVAASQVDVEADAVMEAPAEVAPVAEEAPAVEEMPVEVVEETPTIEAAPTEMSEEPVIA